MKLGRKASEPEAPHGIIAAAITPRRAHETSIDLAATLELVDFLGRSGVDGIALLGSTGEFVHFALDDRRHMFNFAAKRSRVPLLVNVSHSTFEGAIELAREAAQQGAAGVLLMPPYYFRYGQDIVRAFYLRAAEALDGAVPIYLYNMPQFTNEIAIETAVELLGTGLFAGIKDSSGSWEYFEALRAPARERPVSLLMGRDALYLRARAAGASGVVSGVASALPELLSGLERALESGEDARAAILQARLEEFVRWIDLFPAPAGIKEAARLRKLSAGAHSVPLGEEGERRLGEFGEWFRGWLPEVLRECGN